MTARNGKQLGATQDAYARIRSGIIEGKLLPGVHLREEALATQIGVSRTPVRQALMRLAAEGMVDFVHNQGATVSIWKPETVAEIFDLRVVLEAFGAELAAERITESELQELARLNERMASLAASAQPGRLFEITDANTRFHKLIYQAARNDRLIQFLTQLIEIPLVLQTFRSYRPDELQRSIHQHGDLISALQAGDSSWAGAVMRAHLLSGKRSFEIRAVRIRNFKRTDTT